MIQEAVRKMEKNLVIIIMAFHSGLSLTRLNMAIRDLYYIYLEKFNGRVRFDILHSHTVKRQADNYLFSYCKYRNLCSMFYCNIFGVHSINFYFSNFLGNSNKSPLDATAQSLFIVLKDHKSAEAITLIRESYENVVCQAALEQ